MRPSAASMRARTDAAVIVVKPSRRHGFWRCPLQCAAAIAKPAARMSSIESASDWSDRRQKSARDTDRAPSDVANALTTRQLVRQNIRALSRRQRYLTMAAEVTVPVSRGAVLSIDRFVKCRTQRAR